MLEEVQSEKPMNYFDQQLNQKRQIKVKTCADIYNYWRTCKRLYKKAPKDGVEFQIDYLDTGLALNHELRSKAPIVLALHGAPGSYNDFSLLIEHLNRQKVRVIAPNFPEYTATVKRKVLFRHSADEKAAYLRDFLKEINVTKIDLLVSHSSAIFPTLLILINANQGAITKQKQQGSQVSKKNNNHVIVNFDVAIDVKSVALFNPAGHRLPRLMKPTWLKCASVQIYRHKLSRSFIRKLGPIFLPVVGFPVKSDNMDNVMLSATVMRNSKCQRVVQQLEQLSQLRVPTLLVFSENDKLIEKEIFYEMTQYMKLDPKNFDIFYNDGDIQLSQSIRDNWIRVMIFKAGGHYAYLNYAKAVNKAVSELLAKVTNQPLEG